LRETTDPGRGLSEGLSSSVQLRQKDRQKDRPFGYLAALLGFNRLKRRMEIKGQAFWLILATGPAVTVA
jgi:hypothetical protein